MFRGLLLSSTGLVIFYSIIMNQSFAILSQRFVLANVKITSPFDGEKFLTGRSVTVYGTGPTNTANYQCKVSVSLDNRGIYQSATPTGSFGLYDYSRWYFTIPEIHLGQNMITAKYSCDNNPNLVSYDTINILGFFAGTTINHDGIRHDGIRHDGGGGGGTDGGGGGGCNDIAICSPPPPVAKPPREPPDGGGGSS